MHRRHGVTHAMPETVCAWTPALDPRAARAQTHRPPPSAVECARAGATATNMPLPNQCHAAPLAPLASELCRCTRRRCECTPVPRCTTRRSRMIGCAVGRRLCLSAPRLQMTRRSTPCMCAKFCGVTNRHSYNFFVGDHEEAESGRPLGEPSAPMQEAIEAATPRRKLSLLERLMVGYGREAEPDAAPDAVAEMPTQTRARSELAADQDTDASAAAGPAFKRPRGRPRKVLPEKPPVWLPRPPSAGSLHMAEQPASKRAGSAQPTGQDSSADAPKRKRGRPRKYPRPEDEAQRLLWERIDPVDRPPLYPETHMLLAPMPPPLFSTSGPNSSPVRRPVRRQLPSWTFYRRPLLPERGARPDGLGAEPIGPPPNARRRRTPQNYAKLRHWQLVSMARGRQLDVRALWAAFVARHTHGQQAESGTARCESEPLPEQLPWDDGHRRRHSI